jgi:Dockerin type I domain
MNDSHDHHDDALDAPAGLIDDLAELDGGPIFVPPGVDDRVLGEARAHLGRIAAQRRWRAAMWRRTGLAAGLAAAVTLVVWLGMQGAAERKPAPAMSPGVAIREDIDGNGKVNILDAFAVARAVQTRAASSSQAQPPGRFDMNGDGVVDQRDVDAVAARAVAIGNGARS